MQQARTRRHDALIFQARRIVEERDAALLSLDEWKIRRYMRKHRIRPPEDFWPYVHRAVARNHNFPMLDRQRSARWLVEHGLEVSIEGVPL